MKHITLATDAIIERAQRFGIGLPRQNAPPLIFDDSASMAVGDKIRVLPNKGQPVPTGWTIDRNGHPSTRPQDFFEGGALSPPGGGSGHKAHGLSVMVEAMAGLLSGSSAMDPGGEVFLPGEPEVRARVERSAHGIPLPDATWQAIVDLTQAETGENL